MFDLAAIPDDPILLAEALKKGDSALVAPAPHWLSEDPEGLKQLIRYIQDAIKYPNNPSNFAGFTYAGKGPLGIPALTLEGPDLEYRDQADDNIKFLSLASSACHRLDFIARKAGAWGPECKVTKIIEPPTKGSLTQSTLPGARIGDYIYKIEELGEDRVRYIIENGAGKKVDVTVNFRNVQFVPEGEPDDDTSIEPDVNVAALERSSEPTALPIRIKRATMTNQRGRLG